MQNHQQAFGPTARCFVLNRKLFHYFDANMSSGASHDGMQVEEASSSSVHSADAKNENTLEDLSDAVSRRVDELMKPKQAVIARKL